MPAAAADDTLAAPPDDTLDLAETLAPEDRWTRRSTTRWPPATRLTEPGLVIGSPMLDGELANDTRVQVALSMLNRHGLIAGATGTGKTKTLQLLAGQLSKAGVPVFVADIKGDLTGLAAPGDATNPKVIERVDVARLDVRGVGPPGRVPVADRASSAPRSGRRSTPSGRCCSARSST